MRYLLRPSLLLFVAFFAAVLITGAVLLRPTDDSRPRPRPVPRGDHEIVWLSFAANYTAWERFIKGIDTATTRLEQDPAAPQVEVDLGGAYPSESTAVPEVVLSVKGASGKLRIRWYKETANWKRRDWVEALVKRNPPPLAIIGGPFTDAAIRLAAELERQATPLGDDAPLFLVTQATKTLLIDKLEVPPEGVPYHDRTFRFCFSNTRLTEAVCDFIWNPQVPETLRPTCSQYYVPYWEDDKYSQDLRAQFNATLQNPDPQRAVDLDRRLSAILTSVGTFDRPNREESQTARQLLEDLAEQPASCRPLLVLSGQLQPSRRFLRALARMDPGVIQRFVVTTGDAVSFNTIYRDRDVAWPIQDFPCDLVLFAHRNPVSPEAGFEESSGAGQGRGVGAGSTGTEDVLLYADIVEALVLAGYRGTDSLVADAAEMRQRLRSARWNRQREQVCLDEHSPLLFDAKGDRATGTGECIIWLTPQPERGVLLPEAALRVYTRQSAAADAGWKLIWKDEHLPYEGSRKNESVP